MTTDTPDPLNGLNLDAVLEHWFKYDSRSSVPEFVLIMGAGVCGKTRHRHANYARSHVNVDAGDIFRRIEGDQTLDFPGERRVAIDLVGRVIAKVAIRGKFNVVTEVHFVETDICKALIEAMKGTGYKVQVVVLNCDIEESWRRNLARGPHNISAYCTDEFNVKWLMEAAGSRSQSATTCLETHRFRKEREVRHRGRFPDDFVFQLKINELRNSCLQIANSSTRFRGPNRPPLAFTKHGTIMAATVLKARGPWKYPFTLSVHS